MPLVPIFVDGHRYAVNAGTNTLEACLSLGFDLPYFCWHAALGSVGACRQCAVKHFKDENDSKGKLVMACLTPIAENMRISVADPETRRFRAAVIQGLMQSHPHDCPVCDEGGECHLQDMTLMTGHDYRRYSFGKRTFRNQHLGPFVNQEMNRCIQCYRCVRFYRDYAGGTDFDNFGIRNLVFFGRECDGVLQSEFAGNLVEVCPTGVFTDKTLKRHYTRKWDLQMAPSVCVHCSLGCNTTPGERYGTLRRIVNRYHHEVNGYFLCDRGRFGYEFVNSSARIRRPELRRDGDLRPVPKRDALKRFGELLARRDRVIGIGSPRASLEANFALRELVGAERFFCGLTQHEAQLGALAVEILRRGPAQAASLRRLETADAILVLGEDVTSTAPRMALSIRQSVRQQPYERMAAPLKIPRWNDQAVRVALDGAKGPLFLACLSATKLDDIATETHHSAPDDIARIGFAIAHELDSRESGVSDLSPSQSAFVGRTAAALRQAGDPAVVSGISCGSFAIPESAASVSRALHAMGKPSAMALVLPECNSAGIALLGGHPLEAALLAARADEVETAVILENDLYGRLSSKEAAGFLSAVPHVIVLDSLRTPTTQHAELLLPGATFAESSGTFVSGEGRAQRFFQVFATPSAADSEIQESWRWIRDALSGADRSEGRAWQNPDDIIGMLCRAYPWLAALRGAAPPAGFRLVQQKIPREPHRYSGRTAMFANLTVHEPKPPDDPDSPLAYSMEGYSGQPPAALNPFFWSPGWNSIQAVNNYQTEVGGPLRGGPAGVRLFENPPAWEAPSVSAIPDAFVPRENEWLFLFAHHIFGSEELSRHAPGIAELSPKPYVGLSTADLARLSIFPGTHVNVQLDDESSSLPAQAIEGLQQGIALLPRGLTALEGCRLPAWGRLAVQA